MMNSRNRTLSNFRKKKPKTFHTRRSAVLIFDGKLSKHFNFLKMTIVAMMGKN